MRVRREDKERIQEYLSRTCSCCGARMKRSGYYTSSKQVKYVRLSYACKCDSFYNKWHRWECGKCPLHCACTAAQRIPSIMFGFTNLAEHIIRTTRQPKIGWKTPHWLSDLRHAQKLKGQARKKFEQGFPYGLEQEFPYGEGCYHGR